MIFYFTATGNSLYAARQIGGGDELVSIAQELRKTDRHYQGDAIGIVVPLFEFDLPDVVDRFIATSTFDTDYFFIVSTFGMHSGGIAERVSKRLEAAGRHVDYYNTVIMVDNAIQVFDMEEQMRIDPEKPCAPTSRLAGTTFSPPRRRRSTSTRATWRIRPSTCTLASTTPSIA